MAESEHRLHLLGGVCGVFLQLKKPIVMSSEVSSEGETNGVTRVVQFIVVQHQ